MEQTPDTGADGEVSACICYNKRCYGRRKAMLNMAEFYYFSPTGGTRKAGEIFCRGISEHIKAVDLGVKDRAVTKPESHLAVSAAPVYGGRIPSVVTKKLTELDGRGKNAVTLAVYGTRAYEDALLELNRTLEGKGFYVAASAALVAQHSIVPEVGRGRPNRQDEEEILAFAGKVLEKLECGSDSPVKVPGNHPYKNGMSVTMTPVSSPDCCQCGKCAAICPTGAVKMENGEILTELETCIMCMACVAACPKHARALPDVLQEKTEQKLAGLKSVHRENEFFL